MPPADAFLDSFPTMSIARNPNKPAKVALFDATPEYLFHSVAAPRIKALFPQARFVVVLRVRPLHLMQVHSYTDCIPTETALRTLTWDGCIMHVYIMQQLPSDTDIATSTCTATPQAQCTHPAGGMPYPDNA